jgi:hypothetical protein
MIVWIIPYTDCHVSQIFLIGPCAVEMLSVTVGDAFPTKEIGMILDWLAKKRWFSVAEVKDGYWNVRLAEGSR